MSHDHPASCDPSELLATARELLARDADLAPCTVFEQRASTRRFERFVAARAAAVNLVDADPLDLAAYAYHALYHVHLKPKSVGEYLYGITAEWQRQTGRDDDIAAPARLVLAAARRGLPARARRPAPVLAVWLLRELLGELRADAPGYELNGEWRAARDRALVALLYGGALRPGEALTVETTQLARRDGGWEVTLWRSKTNQKARHAERVFIADHDPIGSGQLLTDWLAVRGDLPEAAVVPGTRYGVALSPATAARRLHAAAERAGHPREALTLYSFRRSAATHAYLAGWPFQAIQRLLRHRSAHITERYIAHLRTATEVADARTWHLSPTRPPGADVEGLPRRQPQPSGTFTTRASADEHGDALPLDALRDLAEATAQQTHALLTAREETEVARVGRAWQRFAAALPPTTGEPVDPIDPPPEAVAAFVADADRRGVKPTSIARELARLRWWFTLTDPGAAPPTHLAEAVARALERRDAGRTPDRAPVHPREAFEVLAERAGQAPTATLDRAILRWHLAQAGAPWPLKPGRRASALRGGDVRVAPDRQWVDIDAPAGTVRLPEGPTPLCCPVRAVERLLDAAGEHGVLIDRWKLATASLVPHQISQSCEQWSRAEFEQATWVLGYALRHAARRRMLVAVAWAGALRMGDLREARIEELTPTRNGYELHLGRSKLNRAGEPEAIPLDRTGDALCPVAAIQGWLAIWQHDTGPLLPGDINLAPHEAAAVEPASRDTTRELVGQLAELDGIALTGHSFRRSRATHDWHTHYDLIAIQRLLRHRRRDHTEGYIADLDPFAFDTTDQLTSAAADDTTSRRGADEGDAERSERSERSA
ncbi:tyrosine-type recombinase/integrase [Egibacter rhizosphaerae]|uniref:tyrosine-type recombinase/integrase n=1 Tax=Egibacter rhizosphaerae TaxID=1670831 RepID=UPI0013F16BB8|nr:tyrosine-type recombinase/integrase [Egibacter rhizosphaerae]